MWWNPLGGDCTSGTPKCPMTQRLTLCLLSIGAACTGFDLLHTFAFRGLDIRVPEHVSHILILGKAYDESSLISYLSIVTAFSTGVTLVAVGFLKGKRGWYWIGALFFMLSMDDGTMLHERVGHLVYPWFNDSGVFPWLPVFAPLYGSLGVTAFWYLRREIGRNAGAVNKLWLGFGALATAIVFELVEGRWGARPLATLVPGLEIWLDLKSLTIPVEEFLEFLGLVLIFSCVGCLLEGEYSRSVGGKSKGVKSEV